MADAPDFQNNNYISIQNEKSKRHGINFLIDKNNLLVSSVYLSVRQVFEATWLNDRDQFLFPTDGWMTDTEFQNDCLAYTLFHGQNKITSGSGVNNWIPFTETEVNSRGRFASSWMTDYMKGKMGSTPSANAATSQEGNLEPNSNELFADIVHSFIPSTPLEFSSESQAVFDAGRELCWYYHSQPNCNVNASLYDIREYFQGRNEGGKMNNKSTDKKYNLLISSLRDALKVLGNKIQPKVYEYGFLKG